MAVSFTVVIPTHDRRRRLEIALGGVRAQTRPPDQVIVVADGCTDGTSEAVRELGDEGLELLDLPKAPRLGWGHRNLAVQRARGDVIAYLSDDDLWLPDHLERVGEAFDAAAVDLVQAVSCRVRPGGRMEVIAADWSLPTVRERVLAGIDSRTPSSAVSHRRELCARAGGWNPDPPGAGDLDLWQRMLAAGARTAILREPTVLFFQASREDLGRRVHDDEDLFQRSSALLARTRDPAELTRLRLEISHAAYREQEERETAERELLAERERTAAYLRSLRAHVTDKELSESAAVEHARAMARRVRELESP